MLVKFTLVQGKADFFIDASLIKMVHRNPNNLLETVIVTAMMSPQGPLSYTIIEPTQEVADAINTALYSIPVLH